MPVRIKKNTPDFKKLIREAKIQYASKAPPLIKKKILEVILSGRSPVKGVGRYQKYSESYRKAISAGRYPGKSATRVNLKLSGEMLDSIFAELTQIISDSSKLQIGFTDSKSEIHNKLGAGKSKVIRQMLPKDGEAFIRDIEKVIFGELEKAVINALRKIK